MPAGRIHRHSRGQTKKQVTKIVNNVLTKRLEKKYLEVNMNITSLGTTLGTISDRTSLICPLNTIEQGDGQDQRIGSSLELLKLTLRYKTYSADSHYRLIIVYFPDSDGSDFAAEWGSISQGEFLPSKKDYGTKYRVVYSSQERLDTSEQIPHYKQVSISLKGLKTTFREDTTTVIAGNLLAFLITDASAQGGIFGQIYGNTKLLYMDA